MIGLDARGLAGVTKLDQGDLHATPSEVHGERQADRPRADDQDPGLDRAIHPVLAALWFAMHRDADSLARCTQLSEN
jgi:hypothetical protein